MFAYHENLSKEAMSLLRSYERGPQSAAVAVSDHLKTVAANGGGMESDESLINEAEVLAEKAQAFADQLREESSQ
jgi:hypothetical protein